MTTRVFIVLIAAAGVLSCSVSATRQSRDLTHEPMSVAQLFESAKDFHDSKVVVSGYLTLEWESCVLWHDRIASEQENLELALWVSIPNSACFDVHMQDVVVSANVVLGGTFSATDKGHLFLFGGAIRRPELVAPDDAALDALLRGRQ